MRIRAPGSIESVKKIRQSECKVLTEGSDMVRMSGSSLLTDSGFEG